jgi:hypothetical protein
MIKILLFDMYGTPSTVEAIRCVHKLENENHPVVRQSEYNGLMMRPILIKAWMEFDTEEDAAMFKLTHL